MHAFLDIQRKQPKGCLELRPIPAVANLPSMKLLISNLLPSSGGTVIVMLQAYSTYKLGICPIR